ncbi:carbohydrate sulfotransferase 11-like [Ptychodera flava]|uniref:carbohydrate sulfotransferase 11-like n=1 Tax=Ptychodera flava TaxID=63121 RepID=UPI00396A657A
MPLKDVHRERILRVNLTCEILRENEFHVSQNDTDQTPSLKGKVIAVNEKHKILFCVIAKVGATNWRQAFLKLAGTYKENVGIYQQPIKSITGFKPAAQMSMLKTYTKVMFVRHPFERLLSAYLDKFIENPDYSFLKQYGKAIRKTANSNGSLDGSLTFDKFVSFLLKTRQRNRHWMMYSDSCDPCRIQYDFIGKFDTLQSDIRYISDTLNMTLDFAKTAGHATGSTNRTSSFYSLLSKEQILGLYKIMKM